MIWLPCTLLMLASYKQALSLQSRKADWTWWLLSQKGFYFGCQLQCPIRWMGMFPEIFQNWVKMDVFSILLPHSLASPPCVLAYIQIKKKNYICMYLFLAAPCLQCCLRAFSTCGERGFSASQRTGLSFWWLLLLWSTALELVGSAVVCGLSCSEVCGLFPDQLLWTHVPRHRQVSS